MASKTYTRLPTVAHTHTIIFLHGRDSDAEEFASELFESQASDGRTLPEVFPSYKWVFPSSGLRKSFRFGTEMNQWFDMWSVEHPEERKEIQLEGLSESVVAIRNVIIAESELVEPKHIVLAGISQGAATAFHALVVDDSINSIGAFVGLCTWLTPHTGTCSLERERLARLQETPIFLSHSVDDQVVPVRNGMAFRDFIERLGCVSLTWKEYDNGGHWINDPQGVDDIVAFLDAVR